MERVQRAVISVLLRHILSLGLISEATCSKAEDLVHSVTDFPSLLRSPVCLPEEGCLHERTQDPQ